MIKRITNLDSVKIELNRIVDGSSKVYRNQRTNEIKSGQTLLYKFENIPFNRIKKIANAKLVVPSMGSGTFEIGVFRNTDSYQPSSVHGNNEPLFDTTKYIHYEKFVIGKSAGVPETRMIEIDLTSLFNQWLSESSSNLSITLRCLSESTLTVFGQNHSDLEGELLFLLTYAETDTFSPSFDYLTNTVGFGGSTFVNTLTGRLAHQFNIFQTASKKFPINFSINYIERLTGIIMKDSLSTHWKTNFDFGFKFEESTITIASPDGSIGYYEKIDREDAAKRGIVLGTKPHCFINFMDNSYIVEDVYVDNQQIYQMYDRSKNTYEFSSNNKLLKIKREDGEFIIFGYDAYNQVTSMKSSDGYEVTMSYFGGRLRYVNFINEDRRIELTHTTYGLTSVQLQKLIRTVTYTGTVIDYPDIAKASFDYVGARLSRVTNERTMETLLFEYDVEKVTKITNAMKSGTTYKQGIYTKLSYQPKYTEITDYQGNSRYLTYDGYGMLLQTIDNLGNAMSIRHTSVGTDGVDRKVSDNSGVIQTAQNKIVDGSFELLEVEGLSNDSQGWKFSDTHGIRQVQDGVYGQKSLSIKKTSNTPVKVFQTITPLNNNYTLECFVKTKNMVGVAKIRVKSIYTKRVIALPGMPNFQEFDVDYESIDITNTHTKWTKIEIPNIMFSDSSGTGSVKITIDASHANGELLVDEVRFKSGTQVVDSNLLIGSNFESRSLGRFTKIDCDDNDRMYTVKKELPYKLLLGETNFSFGSAKDKFKSIERVFQIKGSSGEAFTFSFWGKTEVNNGTQLRANIIFMNQLNTVQTCIVEADKTISDWQLISSSVITKRPYDSIKISIEYKGINSCFIDNIALFKNNFGTHFNYNEKGDLLDASNSASSQSYKTDGSKIVESNSISGEQYQYIYNIEGKLTRMLDAKGNIVDLEYVNGNQTKSKITSQGKTLEVNNVFNNDDQLTRVINELGHKTEFTYDDEKRLNTKVDANGLLTVNSYNSLNHLIGLVKTKDGKSLSASYQYYSNSLLSKIICDNGTNYEFIYDDFSKITQIKLNGEPYVSYEYGIIKNGVTTDTITKQTIGTDVYNFSYDDKLRLKQIKLGSKTLVTYGHDSNSNVIMKTNGDDIHYYDYDAYGSLIRETRENGDSFNYDYDNLQQLQKLIVDINDMKRSYDYEYLNEYNEYSKENLKVRLDNAFNDDIIDFNALTSGLHGLSPDNTWGMTIPYRDKKLFRLSKMTSKIIYPLDTVNANRKEADYKGLYNQGEWYGNFSISKTAFGWFRFTGSILAGHKIFAFGNETTDQYYVTLSKSGNSFDFRLYVGVNLVAKNTIPATNELIFIGLRLSRGGINQTRYIFTVNDQTAYDLVPTTNYISDLSKFILGDRNILSGSMTDNQFLEDISFLSIGAYPYTNDIFQTIQAEEIKYEDITIKPKTGVSFINQKTYDGFEVMSLNGSFKSSLGRIPTDYEFIDGTFKLDKTKLFKYDHLLERHVYGSYASAQGFGLVKSLLAYQHDLSNKGTVAINFKIENDTTVDKTILDFRKELDSKLKVFRNTSGKLSILINGIRHESNINVSLNQWHRLIITYLKETAEVIIYLNHVSAQYKMESTVDLISTKLYVGSSILSNGEPTEHINGVIEMLALNLNYLGNNETSIMQILESEQQQSIKTEVDVMGRSYKDIIDTGISTPDKQNTKKLVREYFYKEPTVGKTSLQVSHTKEFDGTNQLYEYDVMGNITKTSSNLNECTYQYDILSRLIESYHPVNNETVKYEYGLNHNLSKVTYYQGKTTVVLKTETYQYDTVYKDKLVSVTTTQSGNTTTQAIVYNQNHMPVNFMGKTIVWEGRRLQSLDGYRNLYQYNDTGIRMSKTVDGIKTTYHLMGDEVVCLSKGANKLGFHYNERNLLVALEYDNENYFYQRNLLGIIDAIIDKHGQTMIEYKYDAWGKWLNKSTAAKTTIGMQLLSLNPFIYKGYIFDEESGLYYLKSRYYCPEVRRFLSPDSLIGDVGDVENHNLFAYCSNNPVMYFDPSGNMPEWLKWTIGIGIIVGLGVATVLTGGAAAAILGGAFLGASVGGGVGLISGVSFDENGFHFDSNKASTGFMFGSITGAISGAIGAKVGAIAKLGAFGQRAIMAGVDGTLSLGAYLGQTAIHREKISLGGALISFGSGLFSFADPTGYKVLDAIWGPMMGAEIAWVYDLFSGKGQKTNVATKKLIPYL